MIFGKVLGMDELDEGYVEEDDRTFETWDLLAAVDSFDEMRTHLNDQGVARPPQMRNELLALHALAMEVFPNGPKKELVKLYDRAEELEGLAFDLMTQSEKLHRILESLMNTEPDELRD